MVFHTYESQGWSGTSWVVEATVLYPLPKSNYIHKTESAQWLAPELGVLPISTCAFLRAYINDAGFCYFRYIALQLINCK